MTGLCGDCDELVCCVIVGYFWNRYIVIGYSFCQRVISMVGYGSRTACRGLLCIYVCMKKYVVC
jgi:hypothetical protein